MLPSGAAADVVQAFEVRGVDIRIRVLRIQVSGFRVQGSGFGVHCLRVGGSGFRVSGLCVKAHGSSLGFRVWSWGLGVLCLRCGFGVCFGGVNPGFKVEIRAPPCRWLHRVIVASRHFWTFLDL